MRIGLLTTIWQRPALTDIFLRYYAEMDVAGAELVRVAAVSPEDPEPCRLVRGWHYVEAPNRPLGQKWQAGLGFLRELGIDVVVVVGSDDFLCRRYFELVRAGEFEALQLGSLYFLDLVSREMIYARYLMGGAGRAFASRLLDRMDWRLWKEDLHAGCDQAQDELLAEARAKITTIPDIRQRGLVAIDVKSGVNAWDFAHLRKMTVNEPADAELVLSWLPGLSLQMPKPVAHLTAPSASRPATDRGSADAMRCLEVGRRVLELLERGMDRVEVYGHPKKERIAGVVFSETQWRGRYKMKVGPP